MSTSRRRKRSYHHGDLRAAVLAAAGQLLEKNCVVALSLREAARRAGVSHNAPYRHFPDRRALLAALAAEGFRSFAEQLAVAEREGGLRARGEAYVRFALANPQRFRLMFSAGLRISGDASLREQAGRAFGGLEQAISAHAGQGAPHAGEGAPHAALAAWALVHGLSHLLLDKKLAGAEREGTEAFVRAVLGAVRFVVPSQSPG
jgi:AcrR family transcriptional regulator